MYSLCFTMPHNLLLKVTRKRQLPPKIKHINQIPYHI